MSLKKWLSIMLCLISCSVLVCTAGCGGRDDACEDRQNTEEAEEATAMGRYVEEAAELPESLSGSANSLFCLGDGTLILTDLDSPFLVSRDNGKTWEEEARKWQSRMLQNGDFILNLAIAEDNTAAVIYEVSAQELGKCPCLMVIEPDGTEIPVEFAETGEEYFLRKVFIKEEKEESRIFVSVFQEDRFAVYEVSEDGRAVFFLGLDEREPEQIRFTDRLMILYGEEYESPLIYDMESGEYVEDEVLTAFVEENHGNVASGEAGTYPLYLFTEKEDVLYLACRSGLYRHAIGGGAMERLIDGNLSVLSSPAYEIMDMRMLAGKEFLALFHNRTIVRFHYDSQIPARPSKTLRVYSLEENNTIRQAAALFLKKYPDAYVKYEIGLNGGDALTREDVLKSLNMQIMAGEGPDVLVMDNMPLASYIEKGILRDLTPMLEGMEEDAGLFENIVKAMKTNDGLYAFPCEIEVPILFGAEEKIGQMIDLDSIAGEVEELRENNPGKDLLGVYTEREIMSLFAASSAPGWITDKGTINRENVSDFFRQTKRIYDAQTEGLSKEQPELYIVHTADCSSDLADSLNVIEYMGDYVKLGAGMLCDAYGLAQLFTAREYFLRQDMQGTESFGWASINGREGHVFLGKTILGVNVMSPDTELAEEFLRLCLGVENQTQLYYGLPVCRPALRAIFEENAENFGSVFLADSEGGLLTFEVLCPDEGAFDALEDLIEETDTPYLVDCVLEDTIYGQGIAYIQGSVTLEEAVGEAAEKLSVFLAE